MGKTLRVALLFALLFAAAGCGGGDSDESSAFAGLPPDRVDEIVGHFNRGVGLMDRYQPEQAVLEFEQVVGLAPDWITGRLNLAIALLNTQGEGDDVRAEAEFRKVIAVDPDNPTAHYALGMLFRHFARLDEAKVEFARVLEIDPGDPDAHYQLGTLIIEDDPEGARIHFEETLRQIPHHESACYRLQGLYRRSGETEKARELLVRFRNLKAANAGFESGMKYGEMGRYAYVVRAFDEAPVDGSDTPPAYENAAAASGLSGGATGAAGWPGEGAYGPGMAAGDVENDGDFDLFIPGDGSGLYVNTKGKFSLHAGSGIDGSDAIGAFFGDYDGDGDPDLYLTRGGGNRLYRNTSGAFADVTGLSGSAGAARSIGACWADADHDGDLDLYEANRGAPNNLWRNNGDGTFVDMAVEAGVDGGDAASMGAAFFDIDDDRDLDLYVVNDGQPNRVFLNDRVGQYRDATGWYPGLDDDGPGLGAVVRDLDANGREDVLLVKGPEPPRLFLQVERGGFIEDMKFAQQARGVGGAAGALCGDIDLDGDNDVVLLDAGSGDEAGHRILMNRGRGQFAQAADLGGTSKPSSRGAVAVDLDGDGMLELVVARTSGAAELWHAPAPAGRHWLQVVPTSAEGDAADGINPKAVGLFVEIKTGLRLQAASVTSSSGYLGSPPPVAHFGLGAYGKADYARLSWPDAVLQGELEVAADQSWRIAKASRKPSSCPLLFSWDGERFAYVTDFLGVGGMGFFIAPGEYAPPDPTEVVRIPPHQIAVHNGKYRLRIAEPLEEVTYLDEVHLTAWDHPEGWEVYPDERFTGSEPFPTGAPRAVAEKIFPKAASDEHGTDMLNRILRVDRHYVEPPIDERFVGYAEDHWLELDFGESLRDVPDDARITLFLHGWIEYTYSHVNYAASQAGMALKSPWIEVPDGKGGWKVAMPEMGFPAGLPRVMTVDVSALPLRRDGRLRIRTNMEVFWDQIFAGLAPDESRIRVHTLSPSVADLRLLGYPREYSPDGANPTLYDYERLDQGLPFKNLTGNYTRFGDVRALLGVVDDQFVIMARGEEIALEFDATALPALPVGWSRTLVLHSDGYCKDMDLYTAFPDHVEPLPYHKMVGYPPPERMLTEEYEAYQQTWNTRRVLGQ